MDVEVEFLEKRESIFSCIFSLTCGKELIGQSLNFVSGRGLKLMSLKTQSSEDHLPLLGFDGERALKKQRRMSAATGLECCFYGFR